MKWLKYLPLLCSVALAEQCQITSPLPVPVLLSGCTYSGSLPSNSTSYIQNTLSPTTTTQSYSVQIATITDKLTLPFLTPGQCTTTDSVGKVINTTCGSGGGGGSSSLAVNQNAVQITSPTLAINGLSPPFIITSVGGGTTAQWALDPSSVTLQGNQYSIAQIAVDTGTLSTSTTSLRTVLNAVATSTAAIGVSTGALQTQINSVGVATGTLQANFPVSVSTNVMSILAVANGGSGTATPGLVAGTNITSITGSWPNQTINAATQSGGGGSSSLAVTTGTSAGFATVASSPTLVVNFDSSTFNAFLEGSATAYIQVNASSVTLQGQSVLSLSSAAATYVNKNNAIGLASFSATQPILYNNGTGAFSATLISATTGMMGTLQAAQFPALTGDVTTTAGSLATTAAALQSNITTFGSSITFKSQTLTKSTATILSDATAIYDLFIATNPAGIVATTTHLSISTMGAVVENGPGGLTVGFGVNASTFVGNGAGVTSLTGSNIVSVIPSGVLVSTVAFLNSTATWTAQQTFNNTVIVSTTIGLGGAGTVGTTGNTLQSAGVAGTPTWAALNLGGGSAFVSGTLAAAQFPALTGDITTSAGALATTLSNSIPNAHTFTGAITNTSSTTFTGAIQVSTTILLSGAPGSNGQALLSAGNGSIPTWGSPSAGAGGVPGNAQYNNAGTLTGAAMFNVWTSSIVLSTGGIASQTVYTSTLNVTSSMTLTGISTVTLTNVILNLSQMAAPGGAYTNGMIYNDSTQKALTATVSGATQTLNGTIWTATLSSNTNTTTGVVKMLDVTKGVGTLTLPANFFTVGKTVYMVLSGTYTTTGLPTLISSVTVGGTTVNGSSAAVVANNIAGVWTLTETLTCRLTGASGKIVGTGLLVLQHGGAGATPLSLTWQNANTIDTTAANALQATVQWGTSSASNSFTLSDGFVEVKN